MTVGQEKPPLDEDLLVHYGVKGMKWGKRNASNSGGGGGGGGGGGPRLLPGAKTSMNVGRKIGKAIKDYNHAPDASGVSRSQARAQIREIAAKADKKFQNWDSKTTGKQRTADIKAARAKLKDSNRSYNEAVKKIKSQRGEVGRNATRVALTQAAAKHIGVVAVSQQRTMGEQVVATLISGARVAAPVAVAAAAKRR